MKIKNIIKLTLIIFIIFGMLSTTSLAAYTESNQNEMIVVQLLNYQPFPAEPGDYLEVWVKISNLGQTNIETFKMELVESFPFSIDASEEGTYELNDLGPLEYKLIKFKVKLDQESLDGENHLKYRFKTGSTWNEASFVINVYSINRDLVINNILSEPSYLKPGEVSEVKISFKNNANSMMRYVNIKLQLMYPENAAGTSYVDLPFTPINSGSEKTIYSIPAGEEKEAIFYLMADPDATGGPYKIPVQITYFDKFGTNHTRTEWIGFLVNAEPDMYIVVDKTDIYKKGQSGEIYFKFVNKGLTDIKFLDIELIENKNFEVIGTTEKYIGDVDSDDYETESYRIIVKKLKDGKIDIPLKIEYRDVNNRLFVEGRNVTFEIYSKSEQGMNNSSGIGTIIFALIVIGTGYYFYKKWEKKNKDKKEIKYKKEIKKNK